MPVGSDTNYTATTPGRKTRLFLDPQLPVVKEPSLSIIREKEEIVRGNFNGNNSSNVRRYASAAVGLEPLQSQAGKLSERDISAAIIQLAAWNYVSVLASGLVTRPRFRKQTELTGITYGGSVQASGDDFLVKAVAAGESWALSLTSDITAFGQPSFGGNVSVDRLAVGLTTDPENQGYCLRFEIPGTQLNSPDMLVGFYFGGPAGDDGSGTFAVGFDGEGFAILFERINDAWTERAVFRYSQQDRICGVAHKILIKPYNGVGSAGHIEFVCSAGDKAAPQGSIVSAYYNQAALTGTYLYTFSRKYASGTVRPSATGAGIPRVDMRRDIRAPFQVSRIKFPTTGHFIDDAFTIPFFVGTGQDISIVWQAVIPSGCTLVGKIYSGATNTELTPTTSGGNYQSYTMPAGVSHFYARFNYTSDGVDTPHLWGYKIIRAGYIAEPSDGETEVSGTQVILSVSVTGAEEDPSHESATVVIDDLGDTLTALKTRGRVPYRLETQYDPADAAKRSVLSSGFFLRSNQHRKGKKDKEGTGSSGATKLYPAQGRRVFEATGVGHWLRLREQLNWQRYDFTKFPLDDPGNDALTWKVTDAVRTLLGTCGYPASMIDIPDNPMRLFPGQDGDLSLLTMAVAQEIGPFCLELLRGYLGWHLVFDPNAGTRGKWRALAPSYPPYTNLATFYTVQQSTGKLANHAGAYGATHAGYYSDTGAVSTFIRKDTLDEYVLPPEGNAVLVIGGGVELPNKSGNAILMNWLVNRDGFDFFGSYSPTKDNPDWIDTFLPIVYVDFTLREQTAVDFFTLRLFHIACHGIPMLTFEAPLVLVTNDTDTEQTQPRPLRYYDPVTANDDGVSTQYLVRNVNPTYVKDGHQWALYELQKPRPPFV